MTQEYTPVTWVDETPDNFGTIIDKARLDQMQTAHHYADGFKEVDAVPTQDPGVDYHMVVYCTADTSFYRWDGTHWTKDIDDSTEARVTALEGEVANIEDGTTVVPNATNAAYLGSSSANVGGDLKPIKIVNGQAQAVTNDLVDVSSAQNITGAKTFKANVAIGEVGDAKNLTQVGNFNITGNVNVTGNITQNGSSYETHAEQIFSTKDYINLREGQTGALASGDYSGMEIIKYDGTNNGRIVIDNAGTLRVGDVGDEQPLLTRSEEADLSNGQLFKWDSTNHKAIGQSIDAVPTKGSSAPVSSDGVYDALTGKVDDVQVGGTSVVTTGTAIITTGAGLTTSPGVIKAKLKSESAATYDSETVSNTSGRQYAVVPDKTNGYLSVNVPWTDYINASDVTVVEVD